MLKQMSVRATWIALACAISFSVHAMADTARQIAIPAGDLRQGLLQLSKEYGVELVYEPALLKSYRTAGVKGNYTAPDAVRLLLKGTPLELRTDPSGAMLITPPRANTTSSNPQRTEGDDAAKEGKKDSSDAFRVAQVDQANPGSQVGDEKKEEKQPALQEVVVTGTHIRGANPESSPLIVYSREDIENSGAATLTDFSRTVPQNLATINPGALASVNVGPSQNGTNTNFGSAFNLRGLGPGATLTLLDGHRLAPAGSDGQFVDISLIPLAAIDHVEILTDGASAVYGADAVAGVVNVILRKDYEGAETSARYGGTTQGGDDELTASQVMGTAWDTGGGVVSFEHDSQTGLLNSQRSYLPSTPGQVVSLQPEQKRDSLFGTLHQDIFGDITLRGDAYVSDRRYSQNSNNSIEDFSEGGRAEQAGGTLEAERQLFRDWVATVTASYSMLNQSDTLTFTTPPYSQTQPTDTRVRSIDAVVTGSLVELPGGALKSAIGAEGLWNTSAFNEAISSGGTLTTIPPQDFSRSVGSVYGEALIPFIGPKNEAPLIRRLELDVAARYDHYSDFGSTTNPKVGLLWSPDPQLNMRGSWDTSFRAPTAGQLASTVNYFTYPVANMTSPTGTTDTLLLQGANSNLRPERSRTVTAGFDLSPTAIKGLTLRASYFNIRYQDQISTLPLVGGFPNLFSQFASVAPYVTLSPTLAQVQSYFSSPLFLGDFAGGGPGGVQAIFDNRFHNLAQTRQSGVDLSASYGLPTAWGDFSAGLSMQHLISASYVASPGTPSISGKGDFGLPVDTRLNGSVGLTRGPWSGTIMLNYWSAYQNSLFTPAQSVASWMTTDFQGTYRTPESSGFLHGLKFSLIAQNVLDRRAPFVAYPVGLPPNLGFDSANANVFGRVVALQITKAW